MPKYRFLCQCIDETGDPIGDIVCLRVDSDAICGDLNEIVQDKVPEVATKKLRLWQLTPALPIGPTRNEGVDFYTKIKNINFPDSTSEEALEGNGTLRYLHPAIAIEEYWEDIRSIPRSRHVHFLAMAVNISIGNQNQAATEPPNLSPPPNDTLTAEDIATKALWDNHTKIMDNPGLSPSKSATSHGYLTHQTTDFPILDGRYAGPGPPNSAPPIELFHPVFAEFKAHTRNNSLETPLDVVLNTSRFMLSASQIVTKERDRTVNTREVMAKLLNVALTQVNNLNGTVADHISVATCNTIPKQTAAVAIFEQKSELGWAGDPSVQGSFSYLHFWASADRDQIRTVCCCPSFIIAIGGAWFTILGAVATDRVIVQRLTPFYWLGCSITPDDEYVFEIARVLFSLRLAITSLEVYYTQPSLIPVDANARFYPSVTSFNAPGIDEVINFRYIKRLILHPTCAIFLATQLSPTGGAEKKIVVKFVERYGEEPHRILAAKGLAPELLYVGPVSYDQNRSYGRRGHLRMVVMEHVEGQTAWETYGNNPIPIEIRKIIEQAVHYLAEKSMVHGDLRYPNILITKGEDGEDKPLIIDFDWGGKEGEVRYPLQLSHSSVWVNGSGLLNYLDPEMCLAQTRSLPQIKLSLTYQRYSSQAANISNARSLSMHMGGIKRRMLFMSPQSTTSLSFRGWQTALWILITSFQYGWQTSALNQIQAVLTCSNKRFIPGVSTLPPCIPMSDFQFSVVTAAFTVGGCLGSFAGNRAAEVRGRKSSLRISAVLVFFGAMLMTISSSVVPLVIGRTVIGLGSGLGICVVPLYLSEISPPSIKGSVGVLHQLGVVIGILVTQVAGLLLAAPFRWRFIPFIAAILSVVQFLCASIAVDSPPWLSGKSRFGESKAAAVTLWGGEIVVHAERLDAERGETEGLLSPTSSHSTGAIADDTARHESITWARLFSPPLLRPLVVVSLAMAAQQFSGVNAVLYYSNNIFAGIIPNGAAYVSLGITVVNALMTFPPIYLIERIGRRSLLRLSALGSVISLFSIGYGINSGHVVFASVAVILFIASFAIGLGPVPFIIISDVTPFYAVSTVSSVTMALNWLSNFVVGLLFLPLRDLLANGDPSRKGSIFYVFGAVLLSLYIAWDKAYQAP